MERGILRPNLRVFDRYCKVNYPDAQELTQEMVESWYTKRGSETNNSCRSRIYVVYSFVKYLSERGLEDGMNIVQISFLLGHEQIQTTMVYLDITIEDEAKTLATLEGDNESKTEKKWKKPDGSLRGFCGLPERKS